MTFGQAEGLNRIRSTSQRGEDTAVVLTEWFADGPVSYRRGIGNRSLVSPHPATGRMA